MYDLSSVNDERGWMINNVHDPAIRKDGRWYYVFSTDRKVMRGDASPMRPGIQVRRSPDLIHWEWFGYALDGVPDAAREWTGAKNLWAPDVIRFGLTYYLYYAASTFGTNQSFIGVATSPAIEGPWTDQGEVFKTQRGDVPNAIDPNIVLDADGNPWMVYGSFFGGIYLSRIDPNNGKLVNYGEGTLLARRRRSVEGAVEGPYIIHNPRFRKYYLFVSYDSLFTDYNIRVGRSDRITGPYVDYNGHRLTDTDVVPPSEVGTKILGGYRFGNDDGWLAPGHNSVLRDGGDYFILHHARGGKDPDWSYLHVRRIVWSDDGWPLVSPERYAGEYEQAIAPNVLPGRWECLVLDRSSNGILQSQSLELAGDGRMVALEDDKRGRWEADGLNRLCVWWDSETEDQEDRSWAVTAKVLPAWDWENWRPTLVFTGITRYGTCIWGKKVP